MIEEQKFRTAMFGGFEKKDVVDYIDSLMTKFEGEINDLKHHFEAQNESQSKELSKQKSQYKQAIFEIQSLKNKIRTNESNYQRMIEEKNLRFDSKEQTIRELNEKINILEGKLEHYEQMESSHGRRVELAEETAKERTNQIIKQAKSQIEQEYRRKMEQADEQSRALHKKAREEASQILKNAAKRAHQVTIQSKEETDRIVDSAKSKAESIIASADSAAEKMLNDTARTVLDKGRTNSKEVAGPDVKFDLDALQSEIEKEVSVALKHLDSAGLSVKTAKDKIESIKVPVITSQGKSIIDSTKRYKRAINNIFKTKDKE